MQGLFSDSGLLRTVRSRCAVLPCCLPSRPQRRFTFPWTGSTASARSCASTEDLSDLPAVWQDELRSDEVAAEPHLTNQFNIRGPVVEPPTTLC